MSEIENMHFLDHIQELRKRIFFSLISIVIFFIPSYYFSKEIFAFLMDPIIQNLPEGSSLIFIRPTEGFITYLKVSIFAAFVLSVPVILYQVWSFISPALYKNEKRVVLPFILFGTLFFLLGASFCYFIVAPKGFSFLLGEYSTENIKAFPSIKEGLSFLISLIIGFGIIFEYPIVIYILARFGIVNHKWLRKQRKYALLLSAVAAALITPTTDAVSMMFMLVPLLVFYEIGIYIAMIFGKKKAEEPDIVLSDIDNN